ncbi:hypothetical protein AAFF_G00095600 [Aldrovandia affinis]|uniref:Uncharacterized protein n=1 Tax=Aldrovandia affinis TaxID=143900 RepID=A0AAD7RY43_9TELE|nr:hypothetical protein AAFF_G00095600 [Aldrovandia affinis]
MFCGTSDPAADKWQFMTVPGCVVAGVCQASHGPLSCPAIGEALRAEIEGPQARIKRNPLRSRVGVLKNTMCLRRLDTDIILLRSYRARSSYKKKTRGVDYAALRTKA